MENPFGECGFFQCFFLTKLIGKKITYQKELVTCETKESAIHCFAICRLQSFWSPIFSVSYLYACVI